jgi:hypothetical protein
MPHRTVTSAAPPCTDVAPPPVDHALSAVATRNLAVAMSLRSTAWSLAESGLRAFRPDLSEEEVQAEVRALFLRATG